MTADWLEKYAAEQVHHSTTGPNNGSIVPQPLGLWLAADVQSQLT
jgi:hypothetical protein